MCRDIRAEYIDRIIIFQNVVVGTQFSRDVEKQFVGYLLSTNHAPPPNYDNGVLEYLYL